MATASEIKDALTAIRDSKNAILQKNNNYGRSASVAASRWKGQAGEAFKDASRQTKKHIDDLAGLYSDLYAKLSRLADSVKRAEAEEKRAVNK